MSKSRLKWIDSSSLRRVVNFWVSHNRFAKNPFEARSS